MKKETPPDRLSVERDSRFFDEAMVKRVSVRVNGVVYTKSVVEYCASGGWARVLVRDASGNLQPNCVLSSPRIKRVHGKIEPFFG